ncbi:acyl carrier protein [Fusobacterium necrophorum subsp. funduliforme B35]|uniref:Uncharacterized protein n=1 Tax=Fusobacterium necrophorum subsp. funduliforme B35 TaxID=1226633 RepID=A0A017H331_9FUSO|nr:acyl carrier protein [Fusobacterium necrophorum]EYD68528.1 acyl carrier protein [Fusobacterium necrophorum subsp. funduliforme B35]KID50365.1 hypothetical protein C095_00345 [Fusobacterium necrophorum subsp. funduliforme B35]
MNIFDLKEIVFKVIGKEITINDENTLLSDLDIDSLSFLEIIVEIEQEKGKEFPDMQIFECKTVKDLINFINTNN